MFIANDGTGGHLMLTNVVSVLLFNASSMGLHAPAVRSEELGKSS